MALRIVPRLFPKRIAPTFTQFRGQATATATKTAPLNEVNLAAVGALVEAIKASPKKAESVWKSTVQWDGGFKATASTGLNGKQEIKSDEPTTLGGTSTAPNPVEIVLSGLGQCLAVGYAAAASVHSIKINSLKIELTGDINLMPFLGLGQAQGSDNAGYRGIKVDVHLDAEGDKKVLEAIHQHVMATSPVGHTISRPVPVDFKLHTN